MISKAAIHPAGLRQARTRAFCETSNFLELGRHHRLCEVHRSAFCEPLDSLLLNLLLWIHGKHRDVCAWDRSAREELLLRLHVISDVTGEQRRMMLARILNNTAVRHRRDRNMSALVHIRLG